MSYTIVKTSDGVRHFYGYAPKTGWVDLSTAGAITPAEWCHSDFLLEGDDAQASFEIIRCGVTFFNAAEPYQWSAGVYVEHPMGSAEWITLLRAESQHNQNNYVMYNDPYPLIDPGSSICIQSKWAAHPTNNATWQYPNGSPNGRIAWYMSYRVKA